MYKILKLMPSKVKVYILLGIFFSILQPLMFILIPSFTKQFITIVADPSINQITFFNWTFTPNINPILALALIMIGFGLLTYLIIFLANFFTGRAGVWSLYYLRKNLFDHILTLSRQDLDNISYATIITRFSNDITKIQNGIFVFVRRLFGAPFYIIWGLLFAIITNVTLSISIFIIVPLLLISAIFFILILFPLYRKENYALEILNEKAKQDLNGIELIKAYNLETRQFNSYEQKNENYLAIMRKAINIGVVAWPLDDLIINLGTAILFIIIAFQANSLTQADIVKQIGDLYQLSLYTSLIAHGIFATIFTSNQLFRFTISANRYSQLIQTKSVIKNNNSSNLIQNGNINFKGVSFWYTDDQKQGISDITFDVKSGQTIGIVGRTGSGKSTLVKLLVREYLPNKGEITIDNISLTEINTQNFYNSISISYQKPLLLSGTIDSNIQFSTKMIENDWKNTIVDIACANFINKLEQQFEHPVAQHGSNLSGGQKQRLSIAQAIAKKPKILILDDATSSLDNETDLKVRTNIKNHFKNITLIMISQRISSVKEADKIIVMDKGIIVGFDNHTNLFKNNKIYQELYLSQKEGNNA